MRIDIIHIWNDSKCNYIAMGIDIDSHLRYITMTSACPSPVGTDTSLPQRPVEQLLPHEMTFLRDTPDRASIDYKPRYHRQTAAIR
jgi:hypothetical protein